MTDIFINQVTGDMDVSSNRTTLITDPVDALRQRLSIRLKTFKNEWFLNINAGLPYYEEIFKKGISKELVDGIFRSFILETPSVDRLETFTSSLNNQLRTYTLSFTVITDAGETLIIKNFEV